MALNYVSKWAENVQPIGMFLFKVGQFLPLFVYFCCFQIPIQMGIQIEKA